MEPVDKPKPNWEEVFKGKDVMLGNEIVNNLIYEDIGVPLYDNSSSESKTQVLVDREVGEEDFAIRQKQLNEERLMGLILPTNNKNEFIFLGITEGGFIFFAGDERVHELNKETSSSYKIGWKRFIDYVSQNDSLFPKDSGFNINIISKEEDDPERFINITIDSVNKERDKMLQVKEKRVNTRTDLYNKLFGKQNISG